MIQTQKKQNLYAELLGRKNPKEFQLDEVQLTKITTGRLLFDENLARYTTMRVGGPAQVLAFPSDQDDLLRILSYADAERIPVFMLGGGSNLIVRDGGLRGLVICLRESLDKVEVVEPENEWLDHVRDSEGMKADLAKRVFVRVEAGASLPSWIRQAGNLGLSGLEGLAGVVGTFGGALVNNSGTRHGEIGDRVVLLRTVNRAGQSKVFFGKDLDYSYRHVNLDRGWFVLEAILHLEQSDPALVKAKIKEILNARQKTQPLQFPNAGSIFKNPKGHAAGEIIERLGLKGTRLRGAKISDLHGNWIINVGNARARDILELIDLVKDKVKEMEHLTLETEIQIVGEKN